MGNILLLIIPAAIAAVILGVVGTRGGGFLKKQGVAWAVTAVMIIAAVGIGYAKSPANAPKPEHMPTPTNAPVSSMAPPAAGDYVWDNARVLSDQTVRMLKERNGRLRNNYNATIGVVTCNYGGDDLYSYAMQCAEDMDLGGYDFIVTLDISGENYWLVQGNNIRKDFTDQTCSDYAYDYMEDLFARGKYDDAVLALTEALEAWYGVYYF